MSTYDQCRNCNGTYQVSGFFPGGGDYCPEFDSFEELLGRRTEIRYQRHIGELPKEAVGYWCRYCVSYHLREASAKRYALIWADTSMWDRFLPNRYTIPVLFGRFKWFWKKLVADITTAD